MDNTTLFIKGLKDTKGRIFRAVFVKKDGTERVMVGRTGVRKNVKGTGMSYNPESKGLMPVFDMRLGAWRMVNANTMKSLKCGVIDITDGS